MPGFPVPVLRTVLCAPPEPSGEDGVEDLLLGVRQEGVPAGGPIGPEPRLDVVAGAIAATQVNEVVVEVCSIKQ